MGKKLKKIVGIGLSIAGAISGQAWLVALGAAVSQVAAREEAKAAERKARRAAEAAADAAKGTSVVVSGEVASARVVYGRALVGGIRVYHQTSRNFYKSDPAVTGQLFSAISNGSPTMTANITGTKNEFMYQQQVLCFAGIDKIHAIDVNERLLTGEYIDQYNEVVYPPDINNLPAGVKLDNPYSYGGRIHVYPEGNVVDPLIVSNFPSRSASSFTNVAYLTGVARLNRDDPQYQGAPLYQCYIEGQKVHTLDSNLNLSVSKIYSNNPAWILLDYLLNPLYGAGLSLDLIDLESFYIAANICDKVVMQAVPLEGKLWRAKGGTRDIRLFECNIGLDSKAPIRDNIEIILGTMEGSNLLWSAGKYKLTLSHPTIFDITATYKEGDEVQFNDNTAFGIYRARITNTVGILPTDTNYWDDAIVATITDNDIIRNSNIAVVWPNSQLRYNFATVSFANESKDFKEDTATWPDKLGSVYQQFLIEDSYQALETSLSVPGISDYYHALAKAEQTVRASRATVNYEFSLNQDYIHLEVGDRLRISSEIFQIPGEIVEIIEINLKDEVLEVSAVKYDANTFAWNVKDHEIIPPRYIYNTILEPITNITYTPNITTLDIIDLAWDASTNSLVDKYQIYWSVGPVDSSTHWQNIVLSGNNSTSIPFFGHFNFNIAVVPVTIYGQKPRKEDWDWIPVQYSNPDKILSLGHSGTNNGLELTITKSVNPKILEYIIKEGASETVATVVASGQQTTFTLGHYPPGQYNFFVYSKDLYGFESTRPLSKTVITSVPNSPINFRIANNILTWDYPTPNNNQYPVNQVSLRYNNGYNDIWVIAQPFSSGNISGNSFAVPPYITGQVSILIKTVDVFGNESNQFDAVYTAFGDPVVNNVIESFVFHPTFNGLILNGTVLGGELLANQLDSFYGHNIQSFYDNDGNSFYEPSASDTLTYVSDPFLVTPALNGQTAILHAVLDGVVVTHNLIVSGGSTFYDLDHVSFYDLDPDPFYGTSLRIPINGSVVLQEGVCQLETIIMSSATVNKITELALLVDVIDIVEYIEDITVDILGSVIPYTSNFSVIKNITATLQANNTNAFVVRVDKTTNLAPLLKVFDVSNTAIGGAKVDVIIKGY